MPQNSELVADRRVAHGDADPIEAELQSALEAWQRQRDAAGLRRALLDLLLGLER